MGINEAWDEFAQHMGFRGNETARAVFYAGYIAGGHHVFQSAREAHVAEQRHFLETMHDRVAQEEAKAEAKPS